jgi:hypothetical protein
MAMGGTFGFTGLVIVLFLENRNGTEILYLSLPLKRATIVGGRYVLAGLLTLAGGAAVFGLVIPLSAALHSRLADAGVRALLSIDGAAGYLLATVFLASLFLPFYHRSGFGRGMILFSMAGAAILAVGFGGWKLAGRAFDFAGRLNDSHIPQDAGAWILGRIGSIRISLGTPLFLLAGLAAAGFAVAISLWFSLRFYRRREF